MCEHKPPCPGAEQVDREAAKTVATFREQGWGLLCNGVIVFEDTGEILPDGTTIEPHRGPAGTPTRTRPQPHRALVG
jgi:hypothetical protein